MATASVILKPGKDKPVRQRHHWIFSGAIKSTPDFSDGDILPVESSAGVFLGFGYFHHRTSISGRMLSFDQTPGETAVRQNIDRAVAMRQHWFDREKTNAYRLVHSEGDGIPGLIVDQYDRVLVIQVSTLGIEKLKPMIVEYLVEKLHPQSIYEKSAIPGRREEGLGDAEGLLWGEPVGEVEIKENGLKFFVDIVAGQKTGFFLDQREMRAYVEEISAGKRVLNCFGYTGGYSLAALRGGADHATTVDLSAAAIALAERNVALNHFPQAQHTGLVADVFEFLRTESLDYDLLILDPPAFAKKKTDVVRACRGYKDINRLALARMPKGSVLVTSSCSYHVSEQLFQTVVFQAALEAGRVVRIIGRHRQASDHPINIYHPENDYLKSLVLFVE